jgi:hypothetical protein
MVCRVEAINNPPRKRTLDIAFSGLSLGGNRCVRSNAPFPPTLRVAVYAVASDEHRTQYRVGVVASGYFEITISERKRPKRVGDNGGPLQQLRQNRNEVTAIGVATKEFSLIRRQPGWNCESIGYHGDDGQMFSQSTRVSPLDAFISWRS